MPRNRQSLRALVTVGAVFGSALWFGMAATDAAALECVKQRRH